MAFNVVYTDPTRNAGPTGSNTSSGAPVTENVLLGTLGALLFALGGGVVWVLISQVGFIAGIAGLLTIFLAITGYKKFGKKLTKRGIVICIIISIIVILLASFISLTIDVLSAYRQYKNEGLIDRMPTFVQAAAIGIQLLFQEPDFALQYFGQLALGLLFCIISSVFYIRVQLQNVKNEKEREANQPPFVVSYQNAVEEVPVEDTTGVNVIDVNVVSDNANEAYSAAENAAENAADAVRSDAADTVNTAVDSFNGSVDSAVSSYGPVDEQLSKHVDDAFTVKDVEK
jgi:hypothetical protein